MYLRIKIKKWGMQDKNEGSDGVREVKEVRWSKVKWSEVVPTTLVAESSMISCRPMAITSGGAPEAAIPLNQWGIYELFLYYKYQ